VKRDERGTAALELALLAPVFLMFVFVAVGLGRLGVARVNIGAAARDAARAGSLTRTPDAAVAAATDAANASLADHDLTCGDLTVTVDTDQFRTGGFVKVNIACRVTRTGLPGLWTPGAATMTAQGVAPVDPYRRSAR